MEGHRNLLEAEDHRTLSDFQFHCNADVFWMNILPHSETYLHQIFHLNLPPLSLFEVFSH